MFPENHHVAVVTGITSLWPCLVASSDDFCCDHIFLFLGCCVATTISCCDLAFSSFAELCVMIKFLCRNTVSVASHLDPRRDNFFWSPSVYVVTTISCRDSTVFPFTKLCVATTFSYRDTLFVVSQFDPWSQPPFHVVTSYLVFCPHVSCDSHC